MAGVTSHFPPGAAGSEDADRPSLLIGRDAEIARLRGLVEPVPGHSQVLTVVGEAGLGKSALIADTARRARSAGMRVLSVSGRETETALGFAGLHQLLRPLLDRVDRLPDRQAGALLGTLGLVKAPSGPGRLLIGIAVLTLLSDVAEETPLLLVVEDAHWLDRSSLDALAFAASRLDSEQVVLLLGTRGAVPPRGFDRGFPELQLRPLPDAAAAWLLDAQPSPPRGRARRQVLDQAAGNPMALIELSKVIAADPAAGRHWELEPLPLTSRLTSVIASRFTTLPADVRRALLIAAIADGANGDVAAMDLPGLGPDALACAEQLGLVTVDATGVRFSHPLVRSAVYHSVPFADRAAVHRQVAATLHEQPERRAWHLATATAGVDGQVASLLEAAAARAQRRGDAAAGVLALERAAELTPGRDERARRLSAAATAAIATGDASWIGDLARRAAAVTRDPELGLRARRAAGWSLVWSNQRQAAIAALTAVAAEASATFPMVAWESLAVAAAVAYQSGDADALRVVAEKLRLLQHVARPAKPAQQRDADALRLWIEVSIGRCHDRPSALRRLATVAEETSAAHLLYRAGSAAWLLDEPELAMDLLHRSRAEVRGNPGQGTDAAASRAPRNGTPSAGGGSLGALGWVYIDAGRWDDALSFAAEADTFQSDIISATAGLITATVQALRGESDASGSGVPAEGDAAPTVSPEHSRLLAARALHAEGIAALSAGDYLMAYTQLRHLFADDGTPLHHHVSYLGVADLAAASVRAERQTDGREILERINAGLQGCLSSRVAHLLGRARAILADPSSQEAEFDKALADRDGERWPFERAQLQLDYAEWLRRRRRINEAKPILSAALHTFDGLGARPWAQRSEAELRACGVAVQASAAPDALWKLTAQQRQIVRLAAKGHSNRDIADRLFLSPRTVSSHLYRSFPKLGVAGRNQLRDVIDRAEQQPDAGTSRAKLAARYASAVKIPIPLAAQPGKHGSHDHLFQYFEKLHPHAVSGNRRSADPVRGERAPSGGRAAAEPVAGKPVRLRPRLESARGARASGGGRPAGIRAFRAPGRPAVACGDGRVRHQAGRCLRPGEPARGRARRRHRGQSVRRGPPSGTPAQPGRRQRRRRDPARAWRRPQRMGGGSGPGQVPHH
jgi:DNA-binding CsgD family transcriptional regulator